jgi:putative hemolysin
MPVKYVDLEAQISKSESALLKKMPRFVVRLLALLIKEKELNTLLNNLSDVEGVDFLYRALEELNVHIEVEGLENLPENGKCFFVANHPFGFVDGLILTSIVARKYGNFKAIGNEYFNLIPQIRTLIAAVSVFGKTPKEYLKELDKVFQSETPITHFPAGRVSRLKNWKIRDIDWQKSFIAKSGSCKRDIVPFYFYGRNSILFYSIFVFRKTLGIKANLELSLLPHEIFNKRNRTIRVKIGKPIPYQTFDHSKSQREWAEWLKNHVYSLK